MCGRARRFPGDIWGAILESASVADLPDNDRLRGQAIRLAGKRGESWIPTSTGVVDRVVTSVVVKHSGRVRRLSCRSSGLSPPAWGVETGVAIIPTPAATRRFRAIDRQPYRRRSGADMLHGEWGVRAVREVREQAGRPVRRGNAGRAGRTFDATSARRRGCPYINGAGTGGRGPPSRTPGGRVGLPSDCPANHRTPLCMTRGAGGMKSTLIRLSLITTSVCATTPDIDDGDLAERHVAAVTARRALEFCAAVENLAHRATPDATDRVVCCGRRLRPQVSVARPPPPRT